MTHSMNLKRAAALLAKLTNTPASRCSSWSSTPASSRIERNLTTVTAAQDADSELPTLKVSELLAARDPNDIRPAKLRTVASGSGARHAVDEMIHGSTGSLLVIDDQSRIVGQVSERDYLLKLSHGSYAPSDLKVDQILHGSLLAASPDSSVTQVLQNMLATDRRHVVVLTDTAAAQASSFASTARPALSSVSSVVSLRDVVSFLSRTLTPYEGQAKEGGAEQGNGAAGAGAKAQAQPDAAAKASLSWRSRVDDLLSSLPANRIVLNARLEDGISVAAAANHMAEKGMGCLVVVDKAGAIAGIFTVRDFLTRVVCPGLNATSTPVESVMTRDIVAIPPDRSILRAACSMAKRGFRHLPVLDKGSGGLLGVVSMSDAARCFLPMPEATLGKLAAQAKDGQQMHTVVPPTR